MAGAEHVEGRAGDGEVKVGLEKVTDRSPCLESQLPPTKAVCVVGSHCLLEGSEGLGTAGHLFPADLSSQLH